MSHLMNTYACLPVVFAHGDGKLDHRHRRQALSRRVVGYRRLDAWHNHPGTGRGDRRASRGACCIRRTFTASCCRKSWPTNSAALSGMDEVFFCNSLRSQRGGDQARAFLRPSTRHRRAGDHRHGEGLSTGGTLATLSATGNRKTQAGFEPWSAASSGCLMTTWRWPA